MDLKKPRVVRCPDHGAGNVGGGVAFYECGCAVSEDVMTDQGGPLGRLRDAIEEFGSWIGPAPAKIEAKETIDAELARVEARIERLARFVRAWDARREAIWSLAGREEFDAGYARAERDLVEARAAITGEDVAS